MSCVSIKYYNYRPQNSAQLMIF